MIELIVVIAISLSIGFIVAVYVESKMKRQTIKKGDIKRFTQMIKSCNCSRKLDAHIDIIDTYLASHDIDFHTTNLRELCHLKDKIREKKNELL